MSEARRTPGFTAEIALGPPSRSYATGRRAGAVQGGEVVAQAVWLPDGSPSSDCIKGCICVSQDGCPCCDSLPTMEGRSWR